MCLFCDLVGFWFLGFLSYSNVADTNVSRNEKSFIKRNPNVTVSYYCSPVNGYIMQHGNC